MGSSVAISMPSGRAGSGRLLEVDRHPEEVARRLEPVPAARKRRVGIGVDGHRRGGRSAAAGTAPAPRARSSRAARARADATAVQPGSNVASPCSPARRGGGRSVAGAPPSAPPATRLASVEPLPTRPELLAQGPVRLARSRSRARSAPSVLGVLRRGRRTFTPQRQLVERVGHPARSGSSRSGADSACSPSRLIQTVVQAELRARARCRGSGSPPTWTWCCAVGRRQLEEPLPVGVRRLVRADSSAVTTRSKGTPSVRSATPRSARDRCSRASRGATRARELLERRAAPPETRANRAASCGERVTARARGSQPASLREALERERQHLR